MAFARVLLGEGFLHQFLLQIASLGPQGEAVHFFKNLLDGKNCWKSKSTTAKHFYFCLITSRQPDTAEQSSQWLFPVMKCGSRI